MPTYEYACNGCGHKYELFESITSKPNKSCPKCKKKKAERLISGGGGLMFKGSGFYITDYKNKGASAPAASAPAAETKTAAPKTCSDGSPCKSGCD